jgi:SpoVK/Ycf46/Vps4 family AAA+-type ATPase
MATTLKELERSKYHGENDWRRAEQLAELGALETTLAKSSKPTAASDTQVSAAFVYPNGLAHLADELVYVRSLLRRLLNKLDALHPKEGQLGGLAISAEEIEHFLEGAAAPVDQDQETFIAALRQRIDERIVSTRAAGTTLPLADLIEAFGLTEVEREAFLVLLAPEIEPAFERAYAFAWNDFTRKTADLGFVLGMIAGHFQERLSQSGIFSPTEALIWNGLVEVEAPSGGLGRGFMARPVKLASRVVSFLLGDTAPDALIQPVSRLIVPEATREQIVLQEEDMEVIWRALTSAFEARESKICLRGARGCGKKLILESFVAERSRPIFVVDLESLLAQPQLLEPSLKAARREALLQGAVLYLDCMAIEQSSDIVRSQQLSVERILGDFPGHLVLGAAQTMPFFGGARGGVSDIHVPMPEPEQRALLWQQFMPEDAKLVPGTDLSELAKQYPLTGGGIANAARGGLERARQRNPKHPVARRSDFVDAAREQLTGRLQNLATRITTTLSWSDLVLPEESMDRLGELTAFARHRKKVFEEWGFGAILPYGRGLSALFHGPPGTGKTMVAGIIAGELGMDLFRVDLSRITSKYVGETEKNLARIFDEAGQSHSVLLFDEADSLFAKRTEVKSATDRYANLEVNYLLQRMEDFEGVTILTTNFEMGLDDAFKRRLRFRIEFPVPDEAAREELWKKMLPAAAELEPGVRWDDLAYDFDLSGGHIKNAVIRAAFVAAERGDMIRYDDLRVAAQQECKEIGRLVREYPDDDTEVQEL